MKLMGYGLSVLMVLGVTTFLIEADAQHQNLTYNVGVITDEPFTCHENAPCRRSGIEEITHDGCLFNGIRTVGGTCVHGFFPDLLNIIRDHTGASLRVSVITPPRYNMVVQETTRPGRQVGL